MLQISHFRVFLRLFSNRENDRGLIFNADSPVDADGDEVEDGGRGTYDVHGDVEVTQNEGQRPQPINL